MKKKTEKAPKHGDGWRDAEWQSIEVYERTEAWGDVAYVCVVQNGTKRPYQTANELRYSWAKMLGKAKHPGDIIVTARDF